MTIAAQLEETSDETGERREPRLTLRLEARGSTGAGAAQVLIHNISATGLLLESPEPLATGEKFAIDLPHAGSTRAKVVWASGNLFGCQFHTPITAAALSAAQLRGLSEPTIDIAPPPPQQQAAPAVHESFGVRLQRLRKERGLTLAQVAAHIGVSKPTIWAWENGKTRPLESRIEALATVLGVPSSQLEGKIAAGENEDLLTRSREQIAEAFGTIPANVRIMIEL